MNDLPDDSGDGRMLERRVARLEHKAEQIDNRLSSMELILAEIRGQLSQMPTALDYAALRADVARIEGRLTNMPTTWQLFLALVTTIVTTWSAGAAIVFALLRFAPK